MKDNSFTIFLIDDEYEILEVYEYFLKDRYKIEKFVSPLDLLEQINAGNIPDLFIVDIKMPGINGLNLIEELRNKNITKPIIVISGHADKKEAITALTLGVFALIDKPCNLEQFNHEVEKAVKCEKLSILNKCIIEEKKLLVEKYNIFISVYQERLSQAENYILENKNDFLKNKQDLLKFITNIKNSTEIEFEIGTHLKSIQNLIHEQESLIYETIHKAN